MPKDRNHHARYQRQVLLEGWGPNAQQKLLQARILVIGAGGLGCPALQYLAAAGAGVLGIVDDDRVAITDLHRQILYTAADEGALKAEKAAEFLRRMNPLVNTESYCVRLTNANALSIIEKYQIIVDASDNFGTRYLVNDACVLLGKPLIYGSVSRFEGQVAVFNLPGAGHMAPGTGGVASSVATAGAASTNYRDLFPVPPDPGEVLSCSEALKVATGVGSPLINKLLTYHALYNSFYEVSILPSGKISGPANAAAFREWPYGDGCGAPGKWHGAAGALAGEGLSGAGAPGFATVDAARFDELRAQEGVLVIDVREIGESPFIDQFEHTQLPLSRLRSTDPPYTGQTIVVFCQSGKRSLEAAGILAARNTVFQLEQGIMGWLALQS